MRMPEDSASAKTARLTAGTLVAATTRNWSGEIAGCVFALVPGDLAGVGHGDDAFARCGSDYGERRRWRLQGLDLRLSEVARANDECRAGRLA